VRVTTTRLIQNPLETPPAPAAAAATAPPPPPPPKIKVTSVKGDEEEDDEEAAEEEEEQRPPNVKDAAARMFSPLQDHVEIPNWPYSSTDAMRLDGQYWVDPKTKTERARPGETYYGPDYMAELRIREFAKQQDLVYQFVTQLAFYTGQSTNMDQYWKGAAAGSRAVELIFPNVFTGQVGAPGALTPTDQAKAKKSMLDTFLDDTLSKLDAGQKAPLYTQLSDQALNEAVAADARTQLQNAGLGGFAQRPAAATPAVAPGAAAAAAATPSPHAPNDQQIKAALKDPAYQLLRLTNNPRLSETHLKLWDLLYNDGKRFFPPKSTGQIDWTDPRQRKQALEAYQDIVKMLNRGEGGLEWKNTPENSGTVFLSTTAKGAVMAAWSRIRDVCRKQWVSYIDLMTHENVFVQFAELCGLIISKVQNKFPGRYLHANFGVVTEQELGYVLRQFRNLTKNSRGFLCFSNTYSESGEAERRSTTERRRRFVATTGRYYSDRYLEYGASAPPGGGGPAPAVRINKKPRTADNPYHQAKQHEKDELLALSGLV
jgi:hypothetical protein